MSLPRCLEEIQKASRQGARFKFLHFWGHQPLPSGRLGAPCLSQWWPAEFQLEGVRYPTAEHFMMAEKARLFGDTVRLERILSAGSPGAAKAAGRKVAGFREGRWRQHRFEVVVAGNRAKFGQHPELRDFLLTTGDRILVEASPKDRIWGIGLARSDSRASQPLKWRGDNLLGFALMQVRQELQAEVDD